MQDHDRAVDAKVDELAQTVNQALVAAGELPDRRVALDIIRHFATVSPPEVRTTVGLVTMRLGEGPVAQSVKLGNVLLNMRKLVAAVAGAVITTVGVLQVPWTAVFGALVVWDSLYSAATVDLSEREASVLQTLWLLRDENDTVADDGLIQHVNATRGKFGRSKLNQRELKDALTKLERIGTIERSSKAEFRWWLREWVRVPYR